MSFIRRKRDFRDQSRRSIGLRSALLVGLLLTLHFPNGAIAQSIPCPEQADASWGNLIVRTNNALVATQVLLGMTSMGHPEYAPFGTPWDQLSAEWEDLGRKWTSTDIPSGLEAVHLSGERLSAAMIQLLSNDTESLPEFVLCAAAEAIGAYEQALDDAELGRMSCPSAGPGPVAISG